MLAIRDGGARIAIELIDQASVVAWIKKLKTVETDLDNSVIEPTAEEDV